MKQLLALALRLFRCVSEADEVAGLVLGLTLKTAAAVAAPEGPPLSLISSATPKLLLPCPPSRSVPLPPTHPSHLGLSYSAGHSNPELKGSLGMPLLSYLLLLSVST